MSTNAHICFLASFRLAVDSYDIPHAPWCSDAEKNQPGNSVLQTNHDPEHPTFEIDR